MSSDMTTKDNIIQVLSSELKSIEKDCSLENILKKLISYIKDENIENSKLVNDLFDSDIISIIASKLEYLNYFSQQNYKILFDILIDKYENNFILHIKNNIKILASLALGCENYSTNMICKQILESICISKHICEIMLYNGILCQLLNIMKGHDFEIIGNVCSTCRILINSKKDISILYLMNKYDDFLSELTAVLVAVNKGNTAPGLFIFQLLEDILSDVDNFMSFTRRLCNDEVTLQLIIELMHHKTPDIALGAFDVFKFYAVLQPVAPPVQELLYRKKEELVPFLKSFHSNLIKTNETFRSDRATVLAQITQIEGINPKTNPGNENPSTGQVA
eukprot:GHVL01026633.1.p1 GENE.GHVL01026633.1~~GHVL01026633.1.p1  ORF type:complete len:335 (+),score=92.64 GHVL01026633.1:156-1160(+)